MADTIPGVSWALERSCIYRKGQDWFLPQNTCGQLCDLKNIARAEADGRVLNGVCITGFAVPIPEPEDFGRPSPRAFTSILRGFRVEDRLATQGGLSEGIKVCGECEANADRQASINVAGCFGFLDLWPESPDLDKPLWAVIRKRKLKKRLKTLFPVTKPLWYGFWIESPLRRPQTEMLMELFEDAFVDDSYQDDSIRRFQNALKSAVQWDLPLHVALSPLAHTDFGSITVFPHCPRCKAMALFKRWQESYPTTPQKCRACGHKFIPNDHHSSTEDEEQDLDPPLDELLGKDEYRELLQSFLRQRGALYPGYCTEQQIEEVIAKYM